ncbi:MAG TPA: hypothetical protein VFQ63_00905 [Patescibacteria group bacterium]|nr:hypothetical protein [Patescibacteria group bacterium]
MLEQRSSAAHAAYITNINTALINHAQRRGELSSHRDRAAALQQGIQMKRELLATSGVQSTLRRIAERITAARDIPFSAPEELLTQTLGEFDDFLFVSDRDGSMTHISESEKEYLLPHGPGSVPLENHLDENGREELPIAFVRYIQPLLRRQPHLFAEAGKHAGVLRDGVIELFGWLKERKTPRAILSANWGELVRGGLVGTPLAEDTELKIHAVEHNDITSTDKATALQLLAAKHPEHVIVYVGDGLSDMKVVEAYNQGIIGWIFALKNSPFDRELTQKGIIHSPYTNYHQIRLELETAAQRAEARRKKAA